MLFYILNYFYACVTWVQGLKTGDRLLIASGCFISSAWVPLFYHLCNFGENVAISFNEFNESIYHLPWHLCSLELQKYVRFMLMITQKPVYLQGFPGLNCARAMFKKVRIQARAKSTGLA